MLIAQISDTHIAGQGKKAYGVAPTAQSLEQCVTHINRLTMKPDLALVTGDICYSGTLEEARHAAQLLEALDCPFYVIPGNHDDRDTLWSAFNGTACPSRHEAFFNYVVEGYAIRLIGLDSLLPGQPGGEICPARASWLEHQLAMYPTTPTIIFMHHPPVRCGVLETDQDGFIGTDLLGDVVERYQNIERIVCGHVHLVAHARWRGTVVSTAPSMGMQLGLDLTMELPSEFILDRPGYQLHYWTPQRELITHTVQVDDGSARHPFQEIPETETGSGGSREPR